MILQRFIFLITTGFFYNTIYKRNTTNIKFNHLMLIPENHICPICLKPEAELVGRGGKNNSTFVLDHCHETNTFRGYICQSCNRGLGMFNSVEIIENAKKYLNGIYLKY